MRVIPLEQEVGRDLDGANRTLTIIAIALVGVGIVTCISNHWPAGLLLIVSGILFGSVMASINKSRLRREREGRQVYGKQFDVVAPGGTLNYAGPSQLRSSSETGWVIGRFIGGFALGIGFCVLCIFVLGSSYEGAGGTKALLLSLVAGFWLALAVGGGAIERRGAAIGLGRGMAVGLVLGLMALGPCALCYMGS